MAKFNPIGIAIDAFPWIISGVVVYESYLVLTNTQPVFKPDPINDFLKSMLKITPVTTTTNGGGTVTTTTVNPYPTLQNCGAITDPNFRCCACKTRACPGQTSGCCEACRAVCLADCTNPATLVT